jgi:hypothetical protein
MISTVVEGYIQHHASAIKQCVVSQQFASHGNLMQLPQLPMRMPMNLPTPMPMPMSV